MHCLAGQATKRAQGQKAGQPECRSLDWSGDSRLWWRAQEPLQQGSVAVRDMAWVLAVEQEVA